MAPDLRPDPPPAARRLRRWLLRLLVLALCALSVGML